ncbi:Pyruvate dehydrogenase complex component E2 1, partial [Sarracenia purpurea var. burkii]
MFAQFVETDNVKFSVNDIVIKAVANALRNVSEANALAKEAPESRVLPVSVAQDVEGEQGEEEDDEEGEDEIEVSDGVSEDPVV